MNRKLNLVLTLALVFVLGSACQLVELIAPPPTATPPRPTSTFVIPPTITLSLPAPSLVPPVLTATAPLAPTTVKPAVTPSLTCTITTLSSTPVFTRPFTTAQLFGTLPAGEKITALGRTLTNWYAFEPGVAQAGNVGIFRMRWVQASASLTIPPDCLNLGKIYTRLPQAGVCYAMVMGVSRVYEVPITSATVVVTFGNGDWAKVLGQMGAWIKLDLADSSIDSNKQGWIDQSQVGFNGCPSPLPVITLQ